MPRIRSIKPDFYDDDRLGALPVPVRFLFIGLWVFADDDGIVKANPKWLKSKIYPYDDDLRIGTLEQYLQSLCKSRMLIPFTYNDENYYVIRNFKKHQRIDKPYPSIIPQDVIQQAVEPFQEHSKNVPRTFQERSSLDMDKEKDKDKEENTCAKVIDIYPFETFWNDYAKKQDTKKCQMAWGKLTDAEKAAIKKNVPLYVASTPEVKYRKNPLTYLNGKCWNDEIIQQSNGAHNANLHNERIGERVSNPSTELLKQRSEERARIADEFRDRKLANGAVRQLTNGSQH